MKFDIEREVKGGIIYRKMPDNNRRFHESLNYHLTYETDERSYQYFKLKEGSRNIGLKVKIDKESGQMFPVFLHRYKNERANIKIEDITWLINELYNFISKCIDYNYIIQEETNA